MQRRAAQRVTECGRMVAREPGATRLFGVGDGDLDDPRHPVDGEGGGLEPEPPHPVCIIEETPVVLAVDHPQPPRRGGLGVFEHRGMQRGDHVVVPVQTGQVRHTRGDGPNGLGLGGAGEPVKLANELADRLVGVTVAGAANVGVHQRRERGPVVPVRR